MKKLMLLGAMSFLNLKAAASGLILFARDARIGNSIYIELNPDATVQNAIDQINADRTSKGLPPCNKLVFHDKELDPSASLADTGVTPEAIIEVHASIKGIKRWADLAAIPDHHLPYVEDLSLTGAFPQGLAQKLSQMRSLQTLILHSRPAA